MGSPEPSPVPGDTDFIGPVAPGRSRNPLDLENLLPATPTLLATGVPAGHLDLSLPTLQDLLAAAAPNPADERDRVNQGNVAEILDLAADFATAGGDMTAAAEYSLQAQQYLAENFTNDGTPVYDQATHLASLPQDFPDAGPRMIQLSGRLDTIATDLDTTQNQADTTWTTMLDSLDAKRAAFAAQVQAALNAQGLIPYAAVDGLLATRDTYADFMQLDVNTAGTTMEKRRRVYEGTLADGMKLLSDFGYLPPDELDLGPGGDELGVTGTAETDAARIDDALAQPPSAASAAAIDAATGQLRLIEDKLERGEQLTPTDRAYATTLLDTLGADDIAALPDHLRQALAPTGPGEAAIAAAQTRYEGALSPFGTTITGLGEAGYASLPESVRSLIETRPGAINPTTGLLFPNDQFSAASPGAANPLAGGVTGLNRYAGITDILATSRVDPSADLSKHVIDSAIQVRQDLNTAAANGQNYITTAGLEGQDIGNIVHGRATENALTYAARSIEGSSAALLDDTTRPALLGLNWDNGTGAAAVITAGTERRPDLGGGTETQARAALAVIQEAGNDRAGYLGRPPNGQPGDTGIPARMTDPVIDAVNNTGVAYLDAFARNVDINNGGQSAVTLDAVDPLGNSVGPALALSSEDRTEFLRFVAATGDDRATEFRTAANLYSQTSIADTLLHGDNVQVQSALTEAGRLDGAVSRALIDQPSLLAADADAAASAAAREAVIGSRAEQGAYGVAATIGKEALGAIPLVGTAKAIGGPALAIITEIAKGGISLATIPEPPPAPTAGDIAAQGLATDGERAALRRDVLLAAALDQAELFTDQTRPELLTADRTGAPGGGPDGIVDTPGSHPTDLDAADSAITRALQAWSAERGLPPVEEGTYQDARDGTEPNGDPVATHQESAWSRSPDDLHYGPDPARRTPYYEGPPP